MAFTAPDFGRFKRHISLQNPCASVYHLKSFLDEINFKGLRGAYEGEKGKEVQA